MSNATGDNVAFWAGNSSNNISTAAFRVTGNGKITATSGTVGGWYIGSNYMGNASTKANSTVGFYSSSTGTDIVLWAGNQTPSSADFYVTAAGKLHCANLDVSGGGINVNSGVFKVESDGTMTAQKGTIGGWTISSEKLYTGSGGTYVCLNGVGSADQSWAMWCGATSVGSAPFRVTRTGDVYINSLKVWDGSAWQTIDFSGNFSNAVSLSSGGSWSGNTFRATVKLWGKINKTISIGASYSLAVDGVYKGYTKDTKRINFSIDITHTVNGVAKGPTTVADRGMDITTLHGLIHAEGVADAKSGTTISAGLALGSDGKSYDYRGVASGTISKTGSWQNTGTVIYEAGVSSVKIQAERNYGTVSSNGWYTVRPTSGYSGMAACSFRVSVSSSGGGGTCFVAGSMVALKDGSSMPIEKLTPGTMVVSYDDESEEYAESEVISVKMYKNASDIYDIRLANGTVITLTGSHPVLTRDGWKAINVEQAKKEHMVGLKQLYMGDDVLTVNGYFTVEDITARYDLNGCTVYNIDVEEIDTYIVEGVVVHNAESKD